MLLELSIKILLQFHLHLGHHYVLDDFLLLTIVGFPSQRNSQ